MLTELFPIRARLAALHFKFLRAPQKRGFFYLDFVKYFRPSKNLFGVSFFYPHYPFSTFVLSMTKQVYFNYKINVMRIIFMLMLAIGAIGANAQQVNGFAKDAEGKGINGATISLLKDTGNAVLKLAASKENGTYSLSLIHISEDTRLGPTLYAATCLKKKT